MHNQLGALDELEVALYLHTTWELRGPGVTLRPLAPDQVPAVAAAGADRDAARLLAHWVDLTARDAATRRERVRDALLGPWSHVEPFSIHTTLHTGSRVPACVGVVFIEPGRDDYGCGMWVHRSVRHCGVGTAALGTALHWAARSRGATSILTGTRADNTAAHRCLERLGFASAGDLPPAHRPGCRKPLEGIAGYQRHLSDLAALGPIAVGGFPRRR